MKQPLDTNITDILENIEETVHDHWGKGSVQVSFFFNKDSSDVFRVRVQLYYAEDRNVRSIECVSKRTLPDLGMLAISIETLCSKIEADGKKWKPSID